MLLKCTADGRRIKVNGAPVHQSSLARGTGMKMTMSTAPTMSARVHRKVMRAPHKRAHPGKMVVHPGKMAAHPGKIAAHSGRIVHGGKMVTHPGKMVHTGKLTHLGRFGKLQHYTNTAHTVRPPEPCGDSNDSGLGTDHDQRHLVNRLSEVGEDWGAPEEKRVRQSETDVKLECDDAIDAYPFLAGPAPACSASASDALPLPAVIRASSTISSPAQQVPASPGKRFHESPYRSCGKLGNSGKLASKYVAGGKLIGPGGKLTNGGKLGGKLTGKYGGKLAQALARRRALAAMHTGPQGLAAPLPGRSRDGTVELQILCQPETQHRARYQTEGSRGAVKDNSGSGFPIVKLVGYDKPAVLQVFIGTDTGRVAPHMFYQACRVSGKNSTPCKERKDDGTVIIEIDLEPTKNWQVTCDCVGILKERNVDVEHRFGESMSGSAAGSALVSRGKKKSTRCRMVFRTEIVNGEGQAEMLQVCSTQIICTQPPGVPEVCRKSLMSCAATGGLELYLLGKNFLKETRVVFCLRQDGRTLWEEEVVPDKEFLQQTHLVCCVPPYRSDLSEPVCVQLFVRSGGKASEPHNFYYTPPSMDTGPQHCTRHHTVHGQGVEDGRMWGAMLPPPAPPRRPSLLAPELDPSGLKAELSDDSSQHSLPDHKDLVETVRQDDAALAEMKVVDLRLKTETIGSDRQTLFGSFADSIKLSSSPPGTVPASSPLASFTQQLQAIHNQVQTDKMVETVTAAIFNSEDNSGQMYVDQQLMPMSAMDPMRQLISSKSVPGTLGSLENDMKALSSELMMSDVNMQSSVLQTADRRLMSFDPFDKMAGPGGARAAYDPFATMGKMESHMERRLAQQTAQMEALVEDAMQATAAMLPSDAAKLDALVNSRADDHLGGRRSPARADGLLPAAGPTSALPSDGIVQPPVTIMMTECSIGTSVKTPPATVKSMILSAAAEILTSDSTMNALVTSAINTANILTTEGESQPPAEPAAEAPLAAAVSAAVTQAVSQAVSHAVSQAVTQEMAAPVQGLTDMSDSDLLSYINPSAFDQV